MTLSKFRNKLLLILLTVTVSVSPILPFLGLPEVSQSLAQSSKSQKFEADQLLKQGIEFLEADNFRDAIQPLQEALALYRQLKNLSGEGQVLNSLGNFYSASSTNLAIGYQQQALKIAREIKNKNLEARAFLGLGLTGIDAVENLQKSIVISQSIQDKNLKLQILFGLGNAYFKDNKNKSFEYFQKSLNLALETRDRKLTAKAVKKIEIFLNTENQEILKNQETLINYLQQSLAVARKLANQYAEAQLLNALGNYYAYSEDPFKNNNKALEYYKNGLDIIYEIESKDFEEYKLAKKLISSLERTYFELNPNSPNKLGEFYQKCLTTSRQRKNSNSEAHILTVLGSLYRSKYFKNKSKAIEFHQQSLRIALGIRNHELTKDILSGLDWAYTSDEEMVKDLQQQLVIAKQKKNYHAGILILNELGEAYNGRQLNNPEKAIEYYQYGLRIARDIHNSDLIEISLGKIESIFDSTKSYDKTTKIFQEQLTISRQSKDRYLERIIMRKLEETFQKIGNTERIIGYYQNQLVSARQRQDFDLEQQAFKKIGQVYFSIKDYDKAFQYWQQQLVVVRALKNSEAEMEILFFMGQQYLTLNNYKEGLEYFRKGVAISQNLKASLTTTVNLGLLEQDLMRRGVFGVVLELAQQHLKFSRELEIRPSEREALTILGMAYMYLGNYDRADYYARQSLTIAQQLKNPSTEIEPLNILGLILLAQGNYKESIQYLQESLVRFEAVPGISFVKHLKSSYLTSLGIAYGSSGDYGKAIEYLQQSLTLLQDTKSSLFKIAEDQRLPLEAYTLNILGAAYLAQGNQAQAVESLQKSLAIAQQLKDSRREGFSLHYLGLNFFRAGNLTEAQKTLLSGIQAWESTRQLSGNELNKVSIFDVQAETYRLLQKVLIAQKQPEVALEIAERGRARAFVESLSKQLGTQSETIKPPNLAEIKQIAKSQNATLVEYSIIYDDSKIEIKPPTKESKLFIWVVRPNGKVDFRQVDLNTIKQQSNVTQPYQIASSQSWVAQQTQSSPPSLSDLVNQTRGSMDVGNRGQQTPATSRILGGSPLVAGRLRQLHQLLIEPIADLLPTGPNAHVIFIPQQSLFFVPFPALQDAEGKRLIEKHTILTAPAIQVLQLTRQQREKLRQLPSGKAVVVGIPRNSVVVGNPEPMPGNLTPLPGAEEEAKAIAKLLKTQPILANQATKAAVVSQLPQARIIHLATHGLLDDPQGTGIPGVIALAPSGNDNGFLTASEILDLKLRAELAVLSACDTGKGKLTEDGVIGLSRSLISAGVPSVMVSLWKVKDDATALLMTEFYLNLNRNPDKAQALRQAMLTTMAKYPDPSAWAAFTLMGEAE